MPRTVARFGWGHEREAGRKDSVSAVAKLSKRLLHVTSDSAVGFAIGHSFSKWVFDLFRNAMIAGVLKYLSDKSPTSWVLYIAAEVASLALLFYCLAYVHGWMLQPFHPMKNQRIAFWLNLIVTLCVSFPLFLAISKGVPTAIEAVAQGQAK
jgi:hypothetical protein